MYSWGPDTKDWKKPDKYKYDSARAPYLDKLAADASAKGPRSYSRRSTPENKLVNTSGKEISSDSENPVVIAVDVTGSMSSWPAEIFDRLPLLYQTLSQYRQDVEISFAAIGDANCDAYPLQVNNFGKGVSLDDHIKALCAEGGGGGQISESYELFAYFMAEKTNIPKAKNPFLIIYGDEKFYPDIDPAHVKRLIGDVLTSPLNSKQVWQKVMQKFEVYYLQKPYGDGYDTKTTNEVKKYWADAIGADHIIQLQTYDRAVDIAMGLIAKHWGKFDDFSENLEARHDDRESKVVYDTLKVIHEDKSGKSVLKDKPAGKLTKPLA
jgi:hypothetical protein